MIQPGFLLAGRYRIEEPIGSGGHAYVFSARQEGLDRKVAVKLLKSAPALASEDLPPDKIQTLIKRFEREAKLISQLRDPGTITMYDYGATDDGLFYMVVEYVEGDSLKEILRVSGAMPPRRVAKILEQLLYSLQEAHALGVLHRDIKPDNIMLFTHLGRRDQVRLLDFGIAKLVGEASGSDLTAEGSLVGTPRYIAPERIRGLDLTPGSDLYSLGLVAYEMLTGERVMPDKKGMRALQSQLTDPSIKLPAHLDVPPNLRRIIDRMMEKDLGLRYGIAEQVILDLEEWKENGPLPSEQGNSHPTSQFHNIEADPNKPTARIDMNDVLKDIDEQKRRGHARPSLEHTERLQAARETRPGSPEQAERAHAQSRPPQQQHTQPPPQHQAAPDRERAAPPRKDNTKLVILALALALGFAIILAVIVIVYLVSQG